MLGVGKGGWPRGWEGVAIYGGPSCCWAAFAGVQHQQGIAKFHGSHILSTGWDRMVGVNPYFLIWVQQVYAGVRTCPAREVLHAGFVL
ncbi:hypothetical protein GCM10027580_22530 [Corynebacterium faecale]